MAAEGGIEPGLGRKPIRPGLVEPFPAKVRQVKLLAPAVHRPLNDRDETVSLQRKNIPAKSCSVHHHNVSKTIDGQRPVSFQLGEDRELSDTQSRRRQMLVVVLADMPCGLADRQAGADLW